jgi:hypothetical protein
MNAPPVEWVAYIAGWHGSQIPQRIFLLLTARFAHPFYTPVPPQARKPTAHGRRMIDHIQGTLNPIPTVKGTVIVKANGVEGQKKEQFDMVTVHVVTG